MHIFIVHHWRGKCHATKNHHSTTDNTNQITAAVTVHKYKMQFDMMTRLLHFAACTVAQEGKALNKKMSMKIVHNWLDMRNK